MVRPLTLGLGCFRVVVFVERVIALMVMIFEIGTTIIAGRYLTVSCSWRAPGCARPGPGIIDLTSATMLGIPHINHPFD